MKKYVKLLIVLIMFFIFLVELIPNTVYASQSAKKSSGSSTTSSQINTNSYNPGSITVEQEVVNISKIIIGFVQSIGSIASVLALTLIGIKFMLGSAQEKAEYKETLIPYIIGAVMVFGITNIIAAIYNMMEGLILG